MECGLAMAVSAVVPSGSAVAATAVVGSAGAVGLGFATCFFGFGSPLALPLVLHALAAGQQQNALKRQEAAAQAGVQAERDEITAASRGPGAEKNKSTWFEEC